MFILDKSKFGDFNLKNAKEFVEFWNNYYSDSAAILVFSWNEILGNDFDKLAKYLIEKYNINWVTRSAEINKSDNDKIINISEGDNSLTFRINNKQTKVSLTISNDKTYDFTVKKENGNLNVYDKISYIEELNLNNDLTKENIKKLLRWKDPRWLTDTNPAGKEKVNRVLNELKDINDFRHGRIERDKFLEKVSGIFRDGFIYRVFLFHIARPDEYPIADQYVFRAYYTLTGKNKPEGFDGYDNYTKFFSDIAERAGIVKPQNRIITTDFVSKLKEIDNALFAFGQFLEYYG
jgi:hypothetical protein